METLKHFKGLLLALAIGAILLGFGLMDTNTAWYRPHWNPTEGRVVATEAVGPNTSNALTRIWVEYTTAAGQTIQMPREFNLNLHPQFNMGNAVTVLYNEPNPLQHFIRTPNPAQDALGMGALAIGAAVIGGTIGRGLGKHLPAKKARLA